MNDRLAELQGDVPAWAQEEGGDDGGDIEMGQTKPSQKSAEDVQDFGWGKDADDSNTASNGNDALL